jgi:drug/metabolite transporter (DMT)-like permease
MPELYVGELAALATAILWTITAVLWTAAGKRVGALAVSFIRIAMACVILIGVGRAVRGSWLPTDILPKTWLVLGISGFFWFFVSDLCLFKAFLLIGPRLSLMIMSLTPPIAAVLSWMCVGDELALWRWLAMGVTLAGVTWVVAEQPNGSHPPEMQRHRGRGIFLACVAAAAQSVGFVFSKMGAGGCEPLAATTICMLGALCGYVALITGRRRWPAMLAVRRQHRTLAILTIGVVLGPLLGVTSNMIALRHAPTGVVATIIGTMPVLILPFSVIVHREKISLRTVFGAIVAVAGVAMLML